MHKSTYLPTYISTYLSIYFSLHTNLYLSVYLDLYIPTHWSVCIPSLSHWYYASLHAYLPVYASPSVCMPRQLFFFTIFTHLCISWYTETVCLPLYTYPQITVLLSLHCTPTYQYPIHVTFFPINITTRPFLLYLACSYFFFIFCYGMLHILYTFWYILATFSRVMYMSV